MNPDEFSAAAVIQDTDMTIVLTVNGTRTEMSETEARRVYSELGRLFGPTLPPWNPYVPTVAPWNPPLDIDWVYRPTETIS